MKAVRKSLLKHLKNLRGISSKRLARRRFEKFAAMGRFQKA
jgi:acetyl-CoA carboxylase alpha subunit